MLNYIKSLKIVVGLCLTTSLLVTILGIQSAQAESEAEYQKRLQELQTSISSLQNELKTAKDSKAKLQNSLQTSEENIAKLTKKVAEIQEALEREKKQLNQLQAKRAELVDRKNTQQQHIADIIVHVYKTQRQGKFQLLLNQQTPEHVSRLIKYHDYIAKDHQKKIDNYLATIQQTDQLQRKITKTTQQLEAQHTSLKKQQQSLTLSQKKRQIALQQLNTQLNTQEKKLQLLTQDKQHLQDLIDEVTNALAHLALPNGKDTFQSAKGTLPIPTNGRLAYRFGSSHYNGKLKRNGIFIQNKEGSDVISVHHGRVVFSDYLRSHGLLLIIDHGNGYMSLYGHNQALLKDTGDWVNTGEKIAVVGNTGGQEQSGLYFEIRYNGQAQNPHSWLKQG